MSTAAQIGWCVATVNAIITVMLFVGAVSPASGLGRVLLTLEWPILGVITWLAIVLGPSAAPIVVIVMIAVGSAAYGLLAAWLCRQVERFSR